VDIYRVVLKGFHGETLYDKLIEASCRAQAVQIAAALYFHCYLKAEITLQ